jgi:hypothetical protein
MASRPGAPGRLRPVHLERLGSGAVPACGNRYGEEQAVRGRRIWAVRSVRQSAWCLARLAHSGAIEEPGNPFTGRWSQHAILAGKAIELAIGQKLLDGLASGELAIWPRTQLGGKCTTKACSDPLNGGGVSLAPGLDLHLKEADSPLAEAVGDGV